MNDCLFIFIAKVDIFTIISQEDANLLSYKWRLTKDGYVVTGTGVNTKKLHQFLLKSNRIKVVDHINRFKLDNRRSNLRLVSRSLNMHNTGRRSVVSKFKGVFWDSSRLKWRAILNYKGNYIVNKRFDSETDAALAYNEGAIKCYGKDAILNEII
jgi:hypothetical protein